MTSAEKLALSNARLVVKAMPAGHSRAAIQSLIQVAERLIKWCDNEPTDGDAIDQHQLVELLRAKIKASGRTQKSWAEEYGMTRKSLCDVLNKRRDISDAIAKRFGYRKVKLFKKQETK